MQDFSVSYKHYCGLKFYFADFVRFPASLIIINICIKFYNFY